ncbi:hypothetical protein [Sphingobacterium anhuiense]|uniref:Uncharacterized protein n=1 Tax=Sphingobacterium anhuiense TaxID=493780 RepID=A0ABW5YVV5_9SPHI
MKFNLSLIMDAGSQHKLDLVSDLQKKLKFFFEGRFYGSDLESYIIGFTSVLTPPGFEHLFKAKKPLYVRDKTTKNRFTGEMQRMVKLFLDDIVLTSDEYEGFVSGNDYDSMELLKTRILESLSNLDKLPKAVKDFDKEKFKIDMKAILYESA